MTDRTDWLQPMESVTRRALIISRQPSSPVNVRIELCMQQGPEYATATISRVVPAYQDRRTCITLINQPFFVFRYWKTRLVKLTFRVFDKHLLRLQLLCQSALRIYELGYKGLVSFRCVGYLWHAHMLWEDVDGCVARIRIRGKRAVGYEDGSFGLALASISSPLCTTCNTSKHRDLAYIH